MTRASRLTLPAAIGHPSRVLRVALLIALVACCVAPAPTRAQERALTDAITVDGRDPCLEAPRLATQVGAWLERDRIADALGVSVRTDAGATSFVITHGGEEVATRRFDRLPSECPDRRAAVALAIALALDAAILESIGIPAPAPAVAPTPTPDPTPPRVDPPPPPAGERPAFSIELEAWLALELLPDPALGGLLAVSWIIDPGVRIRGGVLATQLVGASVVPGGADVSLLTGRIDACVDRSVLPHVLLGGCAGVLGGALLTSGRDLPTVYAPVLPWAGAAVRAELRWLPVDPLALTIGAEGVFSFVQPRLDVGDGTGGVVASRSLSTAGLAIVIATALVIE
ncbi:hypothetical protein [Sandaracinus amylolyticus]|uniref:Uncharacterized protein n=1 Tax=Sandaracinus amylolyticus TaxID=927083 RepID=A0A0F6YLW5_9BACT|nr:hypothetical protein [Sandaracinus amylolyticus]AKF10382.1 hypothetical protein DB32_007531 [Sandaracinus amylolyticus]